MSDNLKPCPFCGGTELYEGQGFFDCLECGAHVELLGEWSEHWNRRAVTKHFGVETFETTDPNELDGGNNE